MGGEYDCDNATAGRTDGGVVHRERGRRDQERRDPGRREQGRRDRASRAVHEQPGLGRHELPASIPVEAYHEYAHVGRDLDGETPLAGDGEAGVDWLASDEWLAYDVDVRESGPYDLTLTVAAEAGFGNGDVGVVVDDDPVTRLTFEPTGGWYSWADVRTRVELPRGLHTVRLVAFEGGWKLSEVTFE